MKIKTWVTVSASVLLGIKGGAIFIVNQHKEIFQGIVNILCFPCGNKSTDVSIGQNSAKSTLLKGVIYCYISVSLILNIFAF